MVIIPTSQGDTPHWQVCIWGGIEVFPAMFNTTADSVLLAMPNATADSSLLLGSHSSLAMPNATADSGLLLGSHSSIGRRRLTLADGANLTQKDRDWPRDSGPALPQHRPISNGTCNASCSLNPEGNTTFKSSEDERSDNIMEADMMHLSSAELEVWQQQFSKSVKADHAATPVHLWDARVWRLGVQPKSVSAYQAKFQCCSLTSLHRFLLMCWRCSVTCSLLQYLKDEYSDKWYQIATSNQKLRADCEAGAECLWRAMGSDWWEWSLGSCLFFWHWPRVHQKAARDGYPPYVQSPLPAYNHPQPYEKDANIRSKVSVKLSTVRKRRYISKRMVKSLTSYFSIPKGEHDVRIVYDPLKLNLNKSLWAPNFGLPTVDALVRGIDESCWMGDLDIGEMFLNFSLHPVLQPYCGVDVKPYFQKEASPGKMLWERWVRCMMGLKLSPYMCIKALLNAIEIIRGDRHNPRNPFHWTQIYLNLPGDPDYDPSRPSWPGCGMTQP